MRITGMLLRGNPRAGPSWRRRNLLAGKTI
jgi:hypothetical protein